MATARFSSSRSRTGSAPRVVAELGKNELPIIQPIDSTGAQGRTANFAANILIYQRFSEFAESLNTNESTNGSMATRRRRRRLSTNACTRRRSYRLPSRRCYSVSSMAGTESYQISNSIRAWFRATQARRSVSRSSGVPSQHGRSSAANWRRIPSGSNVPNRKMPLARTGVSIGRRP
jgi:hypothetical protein